ncbi:ThiF family adenylyltransferase [Paludifilum halophilum]|uniref:Thiamine biosynthesis protein ThiF n=1 Tax=Paludifilum halophilum TaxID=1642702 RepID=A0A235B358_9BACL|nr:ThiF family adenylyltransferase [Paludifilum halophilum]OYD06748.1 thiamine biosynthesis protein ThiF [Paludifilum halophilum]
MNSDSIRYSRQMLFPPIGEKGQKRLSESRVAVVGMGALGTALAHHMVRSGVGYVRLIDRDFVEASNLQRQMLFDEADAEEALPKAEAARRKLTAINSAAELEAHIVDLTWNNAESLLTGVDLILDGSDNFTVRYLINDVSVKHDIPWIYGGAVSARGMSFTIRPGITPCLRCLFPQSPDPGTAETCDTAGVIGPIIQVIAAYQATEALKILIGDTESLNPKLRHVELWHNREASLSVEERRQKDCPACGRQQFDYLDPKEKSASAVSLCGRDTVQVSPSPSSSVDLGKLEQRLSSVARVERNRFMLRARLDEQHCLVIFPDGRTLVQGTADLAQARSLVDRYVGS